jgi:hypothetical protein
MHMSILADAVMQRTTFSARKGINNVIRHPEDGAPSPASGDRIVVRNSASASVEAARTVHCRRSEAIQCINLDHPKT